MVYHGNLYCGPALHPSARYTATFAVRIILEKEVVIGKTASAVRPMLNTILDQISKVSVQTKGFLLLSF